jgi:tetratricopeptide (TPR) repeat protein
LPAELRYSQLQHIGSGGTAKVYRAHDAVLERWVALKILRAMNPRTQALILAEARAQARVTHPHVCQVYEVGELSGVPYIAMQWVKGSSLSNAASLSLLGLREKVEVMRDVAEGVHVAHRAGLIHLDLKPGNILLERKEGGGWHPYLADFGLVQDSGRTPEPVPVGTPPFTSPEQVMGDADRVDRRADVYGLGATLYTLLAGDPPFPGQDSPELREAILLQPPEPLLQRAPEVPSDLATIVSMAMAKHPQERYPSAQAFADDLQRFLDGEPVEARRPRVWHRWYARLRRHRLAATLLAASLLAGVTVGGWAWWKARWNRVHGEMAQHFEQQVRTAEAVVKQDAMLPIHDCRPARRLLKDRLALIQQTMAVIGSPAESPGHYALGRGLLMLGDRQGALDHLERAWALGFRTQEARAALGEARLNRFFTAVEEAQRTLQGTALHARLDQLRKDLREGGLSLLAGVDDPAAQSSRLAVEGRLNLFDRDLEAAKAKGQQLEVLDPWQPDGWVLEARALGLEADAKEQLGQLSAALALLDRALEVLKVGQAKVPSSPGSHRLRSDLEFQKAVLLDTMEKPSDEAFAQAYEALELCHQVDPDHRYYLGRRMKYLLAQAASRQKRHRPFEPLLKEAETLLGSGLPRSEEDPSDEVWREHMHRLRAVTSQGSAPTGPGKGSRG